VLRPLESPPSSGKYKIARERTVTAGSRLKSEYRMKFVTLQVQDSLKALYDTTINADYINYVEESSDGQAGCSIIRMALQGGPKGGKNTIAVMDDISTLRGKLSHLVPAVYYSTMHGKAGGPMLVNVARVMQIEAKGKFFALRFVDGDTLVVTESPI